MWNKKYSYFKTPKVKIGDKQYDSKFEAGYGQELELRLKGKAIKYFDTHVRIPLEVNGYTIANYYIDFVVGHNDGTTEYVETKGYATDVWKIKWKLFCAIYEDKEDVTITLIMQGKQKPPKIRKALC